MGLTLVSIDDCGPPVTVPIPEEDHLRDWEFQFAGSRVRAAEFWKIAVVDRIFEAMPIHFCDNLRPTCLLSERFDGIS